MVIRHHRPAALPLRKGPVALPGHRLQNGSQENGLAVYRCECGVVQPPAPPTTAAAMRFDHIGVFVGKNTDPDKFAGEPFANAGKSIIELVWDEMDAVYGRLMAGEGAVAKGDKGMARGLATALAILTNPYAPNVETIRAQAHTRWEAGTDEQDAEHYSEES